MDDLGDRGTTRGDGSPVKVIVRQDGTAVAGATVSAQGMGAQAVTKTTGGDGTASFTLPAGQETFIASTDTATATKSVTVTDSVTTEIVALDLQPKS